MTTCNERPSTKIHNQEKRFKLFLGTFTSALFTAGALALLLICIRIMDGQVHKSDHMIFWHMVFAGVFVLLFVPKFFYDFYYPPDEKESFFDGRTNAGIAAFVAVGLIFSSLFFVK